MKILWLDFKKKKKLSFFSLGFYVSNFLSFPKMDMVMIVYRDLCKTTNFNGDAFYVRQTLHPFSFHARHELS
jgi:uncharacterized membrane protein